MMLNAPILVLSDESIRYNRKVVGAISISLDDFYKLEEAVTRYRFENKIFAEIKWEKVKNDGKYINCYLKIIKMAFSVPSLRFHSNSFTGSQFKASYALVRSISWKLKRLNYFDDIGILFDKCEEKETVITRERLNRDQDFYNNIIFCTDTDSKIFNTMQIADLLTGCMAYKLNVVNGLIDDEQINEHKLKFIKQVELMDDGLEIDTALTNLWGYDQKKIQHFNLN